MSSSKLKFMILEERIVLNAALSSAIADVTSHPSSLDTHLESDISALHPNILYVKENATGKDNGTSWANAYTTLQSALTKASTNHSGITEILISQGTYSAGTKAGSTFNLPDGVAIFGGYEGVGNTRNTSQYLTNLIGANGSSVLTVSGTADIIDGVNITGANGGTPLKSGAAIHESNGNLLIYNMTFASDHTSYWGGAIDSENSNLAIYSSTFSNNSAQFGGAIEALSDTTLKVGYSSFNNNSAQFGGAIEPNSVNTLNISNSSFTNNSASLGYGGAMDPLSVHNVSIQGNIFNNNRAGFGGAIFTESELGPISILNNQFIQNIAYTEGGAMYDSSAVPLTITGNAFSSNTAAEGNAIWLNGPETSVNLISIKAEWSMQLVNSNTLKANDIIIIP